MKQQLDFQPVSAGASQRVYACGSLRAQLDFLSETLLRVALYDTEKRLLPTWSVCPEDSEMPLKGRARLDTGGFPLYAPVFAAEDGGERFTLGDVTLRLRLAPFSLSYAQNGAPLFSDRDGLAYTLGARASHYVTRADGERIYGLGDKSGPVNKAGRRYILSTTDAMGYDAASSDPLYKHVPFYICENSAGCYGIFYDTHAQGAFDLGCEINNYYGPYKYFTCEDDALVYYVLFGSVSEIVSGFARLCGRSAFPPAWTLSYCGSTMSYTDADDADAQLSGFIEQCRAHRIECGGFYLSSGYGSIGGKRYVFTWNRDKIPDPAALAERFAENGMRLIANIKPAFLSDHPLYETLARKGYFLRNADGSPALVPYWGGMGSYLDFTNPGAFAFWKRQVKTQLLDYGISCTWNDNNEYDVEDHETLADGFGSPIQARRIRPVFSALMAAASREAQLEASPGERPFLVTRSGCAGLTRLAQTWSGDNRTSFHDLRYNHRQGMTLTLSGLFNFGHDVGGFAGERPSPELFLRWLQYGVFFPRFVIHSWNPDGVATMPWLYPAHLDAVRSLFALRRRLAPYLYDALYRMHTRYEPVLSPLFLRFPGADTESDCFLCGSDLLVAPVFDEGAVSAAVDLPENPGGWYCEATYFPGGIRALRPCPPDAPPVFFHRGGSVFAEDASPYGSGETARPVFTVYPLETGTFSRAYFFDDGLTDGYTRGACAFASFTVRCERDAVRVAFSCEGDAMIAAARGIERPEIRLNDHWGRRLITEPAAQE